MITGISYSTNLEKAEKDAEFMLESYLKEPTAENLHGLRTSSRKLLTILKLLPSKVKNGEPKKLMEMFSKLLDLTQKARHLDIVLTRISSGDQGKGNESLVRSLRKARDSSLRTAQRIASSLKDAKHSELQPKDLEDSVLDKRFNKTAERLTSKIQKALPAVSKGSIKKRQLHRLRQDARKLRYLLELSEGPSKSERLSVLRTWQELLAAIHDNDACIDLLQDGRKTPQTEAIVNELASERSQNYEKFRSIVEEHPGFLTK